MILRMLLKETIPEVDGTSDISKSNVRIKREEKKRIKYLIAPFK